MIICSAAIIHIDKTNEDVIMCGRRHGDIGVQLKKLGFEPQKGYKYVDQGFLNHKGEFMTRTEAFNHACECGQIPSSIRAYRECSLTELFSEDLW